jgi:D-tyrosyl-tRNA(Tyr) deacylase
VAVDGQAVGAIGEGLLVYTGVARGDTADDAARLAGKVAALRIFPDEDGRLNLSLLETGGNVLAVSSFTLQADTRKGRRPAFTDAAAPDDADRLHRHFIDRLAALGPHVECGVFGAHMIIDSVADGPVNVLLDIPA